MTSISPNAPGAFEEPAALRQKKPSGREILEIGEYLIKYRKHYDLTQRQAERLLKVPYRRIQQYEATGKWSQINKDLIRSHPERFDFTMTMTLARRSWARQRDLGRVIKWVIDSPANTALSFTSWKAHNNVLWREDKPRPIENRWVEALVSKYMTRVMIDKETIVFYHGGKTEVLEGLVDKLLNT